MPRRLKAESLRFKARINSSFELLALCFMLFCRFCTSWWGSRGWPSCWSSLASTGTATVVSSASTRGTTTAAHSGRAVIATFLQIIIVYRLTLFARLTRRHFTNAIAEVDFEVHHVHRIHAALVNDGRAQFVTDMECGGEEVLSTKTDAAFFLIEILLDAQTVNAEASL